LAIPNGIGYVYVSPGVTKIVTGYDNAQIYCANLDLGNVIWKTPPQNWY
jgi:outer membrane protein assembly factor BamB